METILLNALAGNYRREVVNGREFIVAPLVSIVPGVLNGSKGALFYPEDEISRDPQAWNGMPLVKGHPTKNGQHISGRDPWVRANLQMGTIYNSVYDGRLQHEAWFDVEDTKRVDNWVYQQLIANRPIEVSTGLFTDNEPNRGTHNGRTYDYVARNYRPDHMAILVGQRGACSNKDGCGINVRNEEKKSLWTRLGEFLGITNETKCPDCGAEMEDGECTECEYVENAGVYGNPQSTATGKFKRHGAGTGKGDVHEAAQRAAIALTDEDKQRGASAKDELEATGHNPASWVADEDKWEKAKAAADKGDYGEDEYWAVVSHIYKRMGGEVKEPAAPATNSKQSDFIDCQEECDDMDCVDECLADFIGNNAPTTLAELVTNAEDDADIQWITMGGAHFPVKGGKIAAGPMKGKEHKGGKSKASDDADIRPDQLSKEHRDKKDSDDADISPSQLPAHLRDKAEDDADIQPSQLSDRARLLDDPNHDSDIRPDQLPKHLRDRRTRNQGAAMPTRNEAINQLVTNCDCWKGKQEVLANKDSFSDEDIQRLLKNFNARKLAVNTLREIGVAVEAPATLTVNEMPAFIKAKMGKKEDEEELEEEEEEGVMNNNNKTTKNSAKKPAPITERLSPDELEVWNNAVQITANEKKKIVGQLVANLEGDYRKEKYKKLMGRSMDDLREMLELRGSVQNQDNHEEAFVSNGIGGFFTPDSDDYTGNRTTDNAEDDGAPLGLPSSYAN